jgi:hypothetical protein
MARPVPREDLLHLSPDPTRRARTLQSARFMVHLNERAIRPGHVHPMTAKYQPVVDALEADGPVILRTASGIATSPGCSPTSSRPVAHLRRSESFAGRCGRVA